MYNQNLSEDCSTLDTANIIGEAQGSLSQTCLPPGIYTVQVSGTDSFLKKAFTCNAAPTCQYSNLGQKIDVSIYVKTTKAYSAFSLYEAGAYDRFNPLGESMQPLQNGALYSAAADTFGCSRTVLPPAPNGELCVTNTTKAIYHEFVIGDANHDNAADSGLVTISNADGYSNDGGNYASLLYKGDANALAAAQNAYAWGDTIRGLLPYSECLKGYRCNNDKICVTPGTYTLVTFGNDNHKSAAIKPSVKFDIVTTKHYNGSYRPKHGQHH